MNGEVFRFRRFCSAHRIDALMRPLCEEGMGNSNKFDKNGGRINWFLMNSNGKSFKLYLIIDHGEFSHSHSHPVNTQYVSSEKNGRR